MKLSVVVPCYNAEAYLEQALGSVLRQTRPPDEIIVVDDGSTDGSVAVARRFGERVRVVTGRNGGASRSRNRGLALTNGDAVMFMDADDVLGPTVLEGLAATLRRHADGIALGPWYRLECAGGRWVRRPRSCAHRRPDQDYLDAWLTGWYHPPCSVLWSRAALERTGAWDQRAGPNDDGEIMMRALARGVALHEAPHGRAFYRRLPDPEASVSGRRYTEEGLEARLFVVEKIAGELDRHGRLDRYRASLGEALDRLAADSAEHPELRRQVRDLARTLGGRPHARRARRDLSRAASRLARALPLDVDRPAHPESGPDEVICYGLDWADVLVPDATPPTPAPAVTVVIPTYERAHLVPRALDSVLAQTFDDFEVLVVDDASTDSTAEVLAGYRDPRLRVLRQPQNQGVAAARNRALRAARGRYVAFLDSDDEWLPHKLERQLARFDELPPSVGLLYSGVENRYEDGRRSVMRPTRRGDLSRLLLAQNVVHGTSSVMLRREAVERVGFFDEEIPASEDYDYWLRLARHFEIDFVEEPLIRYHAHWEPGRKSLEVDENLEAREHLFRKHREAMRAAGTAHRFLTESARRHLVPAAWDPPAAWRLLARAIRERPTAPEPYLMLLRSLVPRRGLELYRRLLAALRARRA